MSCGGSASNVILIGMPGAGKSTVGVILAKHTSRDFVDTDVLIQTREKRALQDIVDTDGHMALRRIEEEVILSTKRCNCVIATGGSAVYSDAAMTHLKSMGAIVFLEVPLETIRSRIRDFDTRGIARAADQALDDLFRERHTLYRQYADVTITCADMDQDDIAAAIRDQLS